LLRKPSRTTVFAGTATALSLLGDQALYALLPLYFQEIGLAPFQVGILLSANRWIRLFTNHLAERLIDRLPVDKMFAASLLLGALLTGVYAMFSSFLVLLIARCLWGLSWSFIRHISVMGVASSNEPENLGQMMGFYNGISRTGGIIGIVAGGILFDIIGFIPTMGIFAVLSMAAVPFGLFSNVHVQTTKSQAWKNQNPNSNHRALLVCGFCIGAVGPGLLMSTLGFILLSRYGQQVEVFEIVIGIATLNGLLLGARWALDTIGAPLYGAVIDRAGIQTGAPACFTVGAGVMVLLTNSTSLLSLAIGIILFFMCGTALATVVSAEASRLGSRIFARYATSADLGAAFGPVIGWTVFEFMDTPDLAFTLGAALYIIGLLAATRAFRPQPN
jgi:MFS family permease